MTVTLSDIPKDSQLLKVKGILCVGESEGATRKNKCKKKLPAERGGKSDQLGAPINRQ